jgi:hypothetical protein
MGALVQVFITEKASGVFAFSSSVCAKKKKKQLPFHYLDFFSKKRSFDKMCVPVPESVAVITAAFFKLCFAR